jgi:hypothetical protein
MQKLVDGEGVRRVVEEIMRTGRNTNGQN